MFETDGEADDRVLGPQPGLPPHSPTGQKDTCQDVRITGHQAVSGRCQVCVYTHRKGINNYTGSGPGCTILCPGTGSKIITWGSEDDRLLSPDALNSAIRVSHEKMYYRTAVVNLKPIRPVCGHLLPVREDETFLFQTSVRTLKPRSCSPAPKVLGESVWFWCGAVAAEIMNELLTSEWSTVSLLSVKATLPVDEGPTDRTGRKCFKAICYCSTTPPFKTLSPPTTVFML